MKNRQKYFLFWENILSLILLLTLILSGSEAFATTVFINEIHYDNVGGDSGEAIEIAGPAGTDLTGWRIALYNGSTGIRYDTYINITDSIPNQSGGFGTLTFFKSAIQNDVEGIALLDDTNTVMQFLSYEGTFTASNGPALGVSSTNIGVFESSSTPIGHSLRLLGTGRVYEDFSWSTHGPATFGFVNAGQSFTAVPTPAPGTFGLMGLGLTGILLFRRHNNR